MRPTTPLKHTLKTALALGIGFAALCGGAAVHAQDDPMTATPPGPVQQPPPPPGTDLPSPTQPPAAPTPPGTENASPEAPPPPAPDAPNYSIQYNGLVDGYYLFNFRNPKKITSGGGEAYYDTRHNSPALALAELNVFKNARPNSFGFKATLITGDTADLNHGGIGLDTGEARYKNVQQLYGTYALGGGGAGVDFGKFYTPFGYEVTESNANYNYSRSWAYYPLPFYHSGFRIYTPVPGVQGLNATFYLVRAIFNTTTTGVEDHNGKPGYIGQLTYADPGGKFNIVSELGLGKDDLGGTDTKVVLNDNNFTYNLNANQLIGLDYVYSKNDPDGADNNVTTNAYAVYYRQQLNPKNAFAVRFSGFDSKDDSVAPGSTRHTRPYEITGTYEYKAATNFLTRAEYRHDNINSDNPSGLLFADGGSNFTKSNQDTFTVSGVFTF